MCRKRESQFCWKDEDEGPEAWRSLDGVRRAEMVVDVEDSLSSKSVAIKVAFH